MINPGDDRWVEGGPGSGSNAPQPAHTQSFQQGQPLQGQTPGQPPRAPGPEYSAVPAPGFYPVAQQSPSSNNALKMAVVVLLALLAGAALFFLLDKNSKTETSLAGSSSTDGSDVAATVVVTSTATKEAPVQEPAKVAPAPAPAPARVQAPAGSTQCVDYGGSYYSRAAVGTSNTSCPFAGAVLDSYLSSGLNGSRGTIRAYSPVTGKYYAMRCSSGQVARCAGGNNAVVYVY